MNEFSMVNNPDWAIVVKRLIRSEMYYHGVTYAQLSLRLLSRFGTQQTESNLKAKINKGVLGGQLLLQIFLVLGTEELRFEQINALYESVKGETQ